MFTMYTLLVFLYFDIDGSSPSFSHTYFRPTFSWKIHHRNTTHHNANENRLKRYIIQYITSDMQHRNDKPDSPNTAIKS
jgi:hypothetical protein